MENLGRAHSTVSGVISFCVYDFGTIRLGDGRFALYECEAHRMGHAVTRGKANIPAIRKGNRS